jgi:hypothetical protein
MTNSFPLRNTARSLANCFCPGMGRGSAVQNKVEFRYQLNADHVDLVEIDDPSLLPALDIKFPTTNVRCPRNWCHFMQRCDSQCGRAPISSEGQSIVTQQRTLGSLRRRRPQLSPDPRPVTRPLVANQCAARRNFGSYAIWVQDAKVILPCRAAGKKV